MVVQYIQGSIYDVKLEGGKLPPADRTLMYPIEYYVSRNTVKSANVWDIAMLLNFLNVQLQLKYDTSVREMICNGQRRIIQSGLFL